MNLSNIHLNDIQVFLAVARSGSLVIASSKLGLSHSTAFRWLKRFEGQIGHRLFDRSNNHYALSETGHTVLPIAEKVINEANSLSMIADSLDNHLVGEVKLTSVDALALGYLSNIVQRFYQQYPGIMINLSSDNSFVNLSKREADIAIRPTHSPAENLIGRKAASMVFGLYASPEYIDQYGIPDIKEKGRGHLLCDYDESLSHLNAAQWIREHMSYAEVVIKLTSTVSLAEFARSGVGLAAIPCFLGDKDPGLTRVITFDDKVASDIWLLTHPDLRHSPKIRAVLDFMFDEIRLDEKLFEGKAVPN